MISIDREKDFNALISKLRQGGSKQELGEYIKSKLNDSQKQKLESILNDDRALNEILNSPRAKELLRKIRGEGDG